MSIKHFVNCKKTLGILLSHVVTHTRRSETCRKRLSTQFPTMPRAARQQLTRFAPKPSNVGLLERQLGPKVHSLHVLLRNEFYHRVKNHRC